MLFICRERIIIMTKLVKKIKLHNLQKKSANNNSRQESEAGASENTQLLSSDLNVNLNSIKAVFEGTSDIIIRELTIGPKQQVAAFLVMVDGLVDKAIINENIIKSLMLTSQDINESNVSTLLKKSILSSSTFNESDKMQNVIHDILCGDTALFVDKCDKAIIISARTLQTRSVDEPDTEVAVRGPRECFIETLRTNTTLLRRKIKTSNLKFEAMKIGKQTQTDMCIAYIKGIANDKIVQEVRERLSRIDTDSILESGYIESFIEDAPFSLFPTIGNSERPDKICAKLLEGRVAILVDGTPFVLTVPYLFIEAFQAAEDYYSRPYYTSFIRLLRWLAFFISVYLPAIYVAVITFHQELLPPALLISVAAAEEGTPFPAVVEALLMQIVYEILREAGVRMPRPIGQAVSIVGALVIGDASVSAGLIGAPMVVVVALTAIASFIVPALSDVSALSRILLLILAGFSGLYGIMLCTAGILIHLCSLRSFGVPYTSPIAPANLSDMKDVFIRVPWWTMLKRPMIMRTNNPVRQKPGNMPKPPEKDTKK